MIKLTALIGIGAVLVVAAAKQPREFRWTDINRDGKTDLVAQYDDGWRCVLGVREPFWGRPSYTAFVQGTASVQGNPLFPSTSPGCVMPDGTAYLIHPPSFIPYEQLEELP